MKKPFLLIYSFFLPFGFSVTAQNNGNSKIIGNNNVVNVFPCVNEGFESTSPGVYSLAGSVAGWTLSSQTVTSCNTSTVWTPGSPEFSIVSTPILSFPGIGLVPQSPLGGIVVARLNNSTANYSSTRLSQTFPVTNANALFQYAFAGYWEAGTHSCCAQASFKVLAKDCQGNVINTGCASQTLVTAGCSLNYTAAAGAVWTNWQVKYIDLTGSIGSCVTIEVIASDCIYGDHYGTLLFDAMCPSTQPIIPCMCNLYMGNPITVNYCTGSNQAALCALQGYATYSWVAPLGSPTIAPGNATLSCISVTNPIPGSVYTVNLVTPSGCYFSATQTLTPTQVNISGLGSSPSCSNGSSGSATVQGVGSGAGYNYLWSNSNNSVVGTSSVIGNLVPGVYSVTITALNSPGCGTSVATTTVYAIPPGTVNLLKPYCNGEAYLSATGGTNYQWYVGNTLTPIPANQGGTASSYTVTNATNLAVYMLTYTSSQGCQDLVSYTLFASQSGSIAIPYNKFICEGASNGMAVISLTPAPGASAINYFDVGSIGTLTPVYNATLGPTAFNNFTVNNLSSYGTYTVKVFDGLCKYTTTLMVNTLAPVNFTLSPAPSTLCPGNQIVGSVTFTSPPSPAQYSYSWSPNIFLIGNQGNLQTTIITPTAAPGTVTTIIYTVVVTPSLANCPVSKTIAITAANPLTPTYVPVPVLCKSSPTLAILVTPPNGVFNSGPNGPIIPSTGIIIPSLAAVGTNTFIYTAGLGTCMASATGSFVVITTTFNTSGIYSVCPGNSTTITATGGHTYNWSNNTNGTVTVLTPSATSIFSVTGTNTVNNCSLTKTFTVTVWPLPSISISGNNTICPGGIVNLAATGANTYTWSNSQTGSLNMVSPVSTTTYVVAGTNTLNLCSSSNSLIVIVNPAPTLSISGNFTVCSGNTTSLNVSGALTYSWSNNTTGSSISITPAVTTSYSVTGVGSLPSCSNTAVATVTAFPLPTINISGNLLICKGKPGQLFSTGAHTYTWSTPSSGSNSGSVIAITLTTNATYTVVGTNTNTSCKNFAVTTITVTICNGIDELNNSNAQYKIYPNPVKDELYFETETGMKITLYNDLGMLIFEKYFEAGENHIDMTRFSDGVYLIRMNTTDFEKSQKIIKVNSLQ